MCLQVRCRLEQIEFAASRWQLDLRQNLKPRHDVEQWTFLSILIASHACAVASRLLGGFFFKIPRGCAGRAIVNVSEDDSELCRLHERYQCIDLDFFVRS